MRGPTITRAYDNDAAATDAAFRNGWFQTGDLGYLDSEGYLFIVGRIKDIINRGGQKVSPVEVEEALLGHPDVLEAGVFAIPHQRLGENVAAVVVMRPNAGVSTGGIRDFVRKRLAGFKVPAQIRTLSEIPKGAGGKIKRSVLLEAFLAATTTDESDAEISSPRSELESQLASMWANLLELSEIAVDQDVFALGADSLTMTQMLSRLRENFGVEFSFEDIFDMPTVAALAARLDSARRGHVAPSPALRGTTAKARSAPLSFQQQRIYVLSRLDPTRYNYNIVDVVRLFGPLDVEALQSGIATICRRHEILRTTFSERSGDTVLPRAFFSASRTSVRLWSAGRERKVQPP